MWTRVAKLVGWASVGLSAVLCGGPRLGLNPRTYEWGRQAENKGVYEFSFTLKNEGDEPLEILNVRPGCGCTKVELKTRTLAPGASAQMTGRLTTKGVEGHMRKGIILTTNDPQRKTAIAGLDIRFPYRGEGMKLRYPVYGARVRRGALWAYVHVVNCEEKTPIQVQALELPEGWNCLEKLPVTVPPEEKQTFRLMKPLAKGEQPAAFDDVHFRVLTDYEKTPRLEGTIRYHPRAPRSTVVSKVAGGRKSRKTGPVIRWPMTTPLEPKKANK